jgi:hypothetical protein
MQLFVSSPAPALQFVVGAAIAGAAVLLPWVARLIALGLALGGLGLVAIGVVIAGFDEVASEVVRFTAFAPTLAPAVVGLVVGKFLTGLLIGR